MNRYDLELTCLPPISPSLRITEGSLNKNGSSVKWGVLIQKPRHTRILAFQLWDFLFHHTPWGFPKTWGSVLVLKIKYTWGRGDLRICKELQKKDRVGWLGKLGEYTRQSARFGSFTGVSRVQKQQVQGVPRDHLSFLDEEKLSRQSCNPDWLTPRIPLGKKLKGAGLQQPESGEAHESSSGLWVKSQLQLYLYRFGQDT